MDSKQKIGFGIIGAGLIAEFHAKAIQAIADATLVGISNRTFEKAEKLAKQFECRAFAQMDDLLADDHIDVVCICTASGAHLEPAMAALEAGKHCLIEKPLEVTSEKCDRIIRKAKEKGLKVGVIFPSRFYQNSQQLKIALNENRFGHLVLGDAYVKWYRTKKYYASGAWRGTWELDGGGALMNQGIHSLDLLMWFMGSVKSVQAYKANIKHKEIEVEDTIVAALEFENGALGTIECSTATYPGSKNRIEIRGTEGSVVLEGEKIVAWDFADAKDSDRDVVARFITEDEGSGASDPGGIDFHGHQVQIEDMILAVKTDKKPFISAEEGRKSVRIIEAIYESAATGKRVIL